MERSAWRGWKLWGALLVAGLLLMGCAGAKPCYVPCSPCDPCAPPCPPPTDNPCNWPEACAGVGVPMAAAMLDEIRDLADQTDPAYIRAEDLTRIHTRVTECKSRLLTNKAGDQVCGLQNPKPCAELEGIWRKAREGVQTEPPDPKVRAQAWQGHWHTIAEELDAFPTGTKPAGG